MLTSKQRAHLRSLANKTDAVFRIGKDGITPELTAAIDEALAARELLKISVLENSPEKAKQAAETLSGRTRSEVVQVIGKKFVLYRKASKPIIELPR
jgi:RNA-binding protein